MFCMHKHSLELPEYLFSLVHDFVHAESGQQSWAFVLDLFHDSSAIQKVQENHFRLGIHYNTENIKCMVDPADGKYNFFKSNKIYIYSLHS